MSQPTSNQTPSAKQSAAEGPARVPDHSTCRFELHRVVREIDPQPVRKVVDSVFDNLLRLLECLGIIENHLRQLDDADETFAFFQIIHDEARVLVKFIREDALTCKAMNGELLDILDGITFAVSHDLQRVFESGEAIPSSDTPAHTVIGKLYRAHDILTNCLQQSTITLAMTFDKNLVGAKLFDNSDMRYRQSLQLLNDLSALLQLVEGCERSERGALTDLAVGLEKFRSETLELLMYSDWPQFESFCERIKFAGTSRLELEAVLHQFHCYLETLIGQVRMRAVLANALPVQFGTDVPMAVPATMKLDEEVAGWDDFAVAV
ncbi:MAG TPA: hypothetical protein VLL54_05605 [Pyrinomonadaceae bacterium]|nr:hypothetical protein [Pyrinomonadaceae bacterium]